MSKEAIEHYEAALKEAFPSGATADVFHHWNEARKALAERPAVSAGPITPAMMQGPTPEQKSQMVAAMSKLAEQPAQSSKPFDTHAAPGQSFDTHSRTPQQEPVAWMHPDGRVWTFGRGLDKSTFTIPLYTSPPAHRTWVGLTEQEALDCFSPNPVTHSKNVEAKLREKNQ